MITKVLTIITIPFLLSGCSTGKYVDDYTEYGQILNDCRNDANVDSVLAIFPDANNKGTSKNFLYVEEQRMSIKGCFLFVELKYSPEDYQKEITRLSTLTVTAPFSSEAKQTLYFEYSSTFLSVKTDNRFEYAKYFDSAHIIAYIYNQYYSWDQVENMNEAFYLDNNIVIPAKYDASGSNTYDIYH